MATQVQNRRGTTAEHSTFTGANGELTVDTTKRTLVVHDGATAGGRPLLREDQSNLPTSAPTTGIYNASGSLAISTGGSGRLFVDSSGLLSVGTSTGATGSTALAGRFATSTGSGSVINVQKSNDGTNAANIHLLKSRGTVASPTVVSNGDTVGSLTALAYEGSSFATCASVDFAADGAIASTDAPGRITFSTRPAGAGGANTERLRITSAGLVGIGTSSPSQPLQVVGAIASTGQASSLTASSAFIDYNASFNGTRIGSVGNTTGSAGPIYFSQYSSNASVGRDAVVINSSGNVGIGTTSPSQLLHVNGNAIVGGSPATQYSNFTVAGTSGIQSATPLLNFVNAAGSTRFGYIYHNGTGGNIDILNQENGGLTFGTNNTERARIDSSGRLLVGTTTSNGAQLEVNRPQSTTTGLSAVLNSPQFSITNSSNWGFPVGAVFKTPLANGGAIVDNAAIWAEFESTNNAYLGFATRSSGTVAERMRIRNDGSTSLYSTTSVIELRSAAAAGGGLEILNGYHSATSTSTGTRSVLIATNGNIQNTNNSYGAISDIKLKENIVDANSQWNDLKALQVRNYNFKEETGQQTHTQLGLIAQEVELVSPGLVSESPDRDLQGNDLGTTTKSVNYSVLYMKAVKALQEAMERIETLEAKVAALESA